MKKFVTLSLVLVMLLASAIAVAEGTSQSPQTVTVKLTLDPAFVWEVPAEVNFTVPAGNTDGEIEANRIVIKVTDMRGLSFGKALEITVDNNQRDHLLTNGDKTVKYQIGILKEGKVDTSDYNWFTYLDKPGEATFGTILNMTDVDAAPAGEYTGTLTFSAYVATKPS